MDGTSGRPLVCENYASAMRKRIQFAKKKKNFFRARDGTSCRPLVCENYANAKAMEKNQGKPKHIRWLFCDFQQAQILACGVSMQALFVIPQSPFWPWMVFWCATTMDDGWCHMCTSFGVRKLCGWYANGMRKFLNTGSRFESYSKLTKFLSGNLVNHVFRYVCNKLKLEVR